MQLGAVYVYIHILYSYFPVAIKCPTGQVQCPNNNPVICISENYLCNEVVDCTGGWDESIEVNCSKLSSLSYLQVCSK